MSYINNKRYLVKLLYSILSEQIITVLGQPARLNFVNLGVSFCLWGMCYTKANKASIELQTYMRAA